MMAAMEHPLKTYRNMNGIPIGLMAAKMDVSKATISRIENGHTEPSFSFIRKVCRETGLTSADFVNFEPAHG